jgi:hypothetical protein
MTSANTTTRTIRSNADFDIQFVDATSAQGECCEYCDKGDAYCVADVTITTELCRFEGEYRDAQSVCWDCIPDVLFWHVGDGPAVVELPAEMRPHIIVNGHSLVAA